MAGAIADPADQPRASRRVSTPPEYAYSGGRLPATAITGRAMVVLLLAHLSIVSAGWPAGRYDLVIAGIAVMTAGQAWSMARHGPVSRLTVPAWLMAAGPACPAPAPAAPSP